MPRSKRELIFNSQTNLKEKIPGPQTYNVQSENYNKKGRVKSTFIGTE